MAFHEDITQVLQRVPIPGLSVAVARGDSVLWSHGYGVADAASGREATAGTPYRIASITKPMAAAVILALAESGDLDLDAPAARYLDDPPDWAQTATVRALLNHTSESPAGRRGFSYSGRYNVLSRVAEGAAGRPFPELLDSLVFQPSGMESSAAVDRLPGSWMADSLAAPHGPDGGPSAGALPRRASAGNGVVSTVVDLTRFVDALTEGRLVGWERLAAAWEPARDDGGGPLPYGLGWFVEETPIGRLVWHGGQWPTYSGLLLHVPGDSLTLAVLANSWHVSRPYYRIGTGTVLYSTIAASFLRHLVVSGAGDGAGPEEDVIGAIPDMPWDVAADSLARIGARLRGPMPLFWGGEMIGRGLLHREAGHPGRGDSLLAAAAACCGEALLASTDLGLLFHLGRSGDPELRRIGQRAGAARLDGLPGDDLTRFHLAVSYIRGGTGDRAVPLLEALLVDDDAEGWVRGWAAYLRAEQLAEEDPGRAIRLLRGTLESGVDESGLRSDARSLLDSLGG